MRGGSFVWEYDDDKVEGRKSQCTLSVKLTRSGVI